ncbi:hypothetical protein OE88DRAFT_1667618 [Heliocybe sulcata]|uniref:Uncharacterized protein n=1 Tax=Heliocybe sulcata TaxID=5364 RepID=A0A5C3MP57_9AGAM|nr:hypothetical protein OE88DRAFT_1667618 [Heliocybe sulcata]
MALDSLQPGEHIIIGNTEFEYAESSDDGSVLDRPGVGRTMDRVLDRVSAPLSVFLAQRLPLRTPSRRGHDTTHVDLTSANLEWLGPGSLITVRGIDYEYADSDASDDDAPGPGHTLGKLVKRVSAPLEMFLGLCSDLLGNGPDAIFCGLMDSEFPPPRRKGEVLRVRRRRNLVFWIRSIEGDDNPLWSGYGVVDGVIARLLPFIIDRRYHFSVRLTAAHYLLVLLARCIHTGHILPFISNILDALLRLCQEGSRRGYSAETLKPLVRTLASRDDFLRISYCGKKEVPDAVLCVTPQSLPDLLI